ncbi:MAG: TraA family conjugative transfer protein [Sulfuricaulis sp.]
MRSISRNKFALIMVATMLALFTLDAFAGTTGTEFSGIVTQLLDWAQGSLGKAIAIAAFIVGAGMGLARGSAVPALIGIVVALFMAYIPGIINNIVSAIV